MPEGDVVRRTAGRLHAVLAGRVVVAAELRWPSLATADLTGRRVVEVVSRGKHILIRLDGGPAGVDPAAPDSVPDAGVPLTLHSHLRMDGSWHVHKVGQSPVRRLTDHRVRAVLATEQWVAVGYRLGMLDLVRTSQEDTLVGHLGPDVLGPDWDLDRVVTTLRSTPDRHIGDALLDQRVLAGVGTFYMSEALFLRGTSPWTAVEDVDRGSAARPSSTTTDGAAGSGAPASTAGRRPRPEAGVSDRHGLADTLETVRRLMLANVDRAVQVTTGDARPGQQAWVHARSGRPCRRCGTALRVAPIGPETRERTAFYCPRCQPGPTPTDDGRPQRPLGSSARRGRRSAAPPAYRRR